MLEVADREVNRQGRAAASEGVQILTFRHRRGVHGGARGDHRLADLRKCQFLFENRRRRCKGGDSGSHVIGNAECVQTPHLFRNRPVNRGIARMHPRHVLALGVGVFHFSDDLVKVHGGGVPDVRVFRGIR